MPDCEQPTVNGKGRIRRLLALLDSRERTFNVLNASVTAIFTVVLALSTVFLWKETKDLRNFAEEQSADMKASIAEAARAATAMRDVAVAVAENAKASNENLALYKETSVREMRAYLTVSGGGVVPQDKTTNYRLEVRLNLNNTGNTPAYHIRANQTIAVLPFPLPTDFAFPLPPRSLFGSEGILGPHQNFILTAVADEIYPDDDITEIQFGMNKVLYAYGTVSYEDAFGIARHTNFSQRIAWLKDGKSFLTFNTAEHNDAD
jgi:hypothetical protein